MFPRIFVVQLALTSSFVYSIQYIPARHDRQPVSCGDGGSGDDVIDVPVIKERAFHYNLWEEYQKDWKENPPVRQLFLRWRYSVVGWRNRVLRIPPAIIPE